MCVCISVRREEEKTLGKWFPATVYSEGTYKSRQIVTLLDLHITMFIFHSDCTMSEGGLWCWLLLFCTSQNPLKFKRCVFKLVHFVAGLVQRTNYADLSPNAHDWVNNTGLIRRDQNKDSTVFRLGQTKYVTEDEDFSTTLREQSASEWFQYNFNLFSIKMWCLNLTGSDEMFFWAQGTEHDD